ncbi:MULTISPECIES: hypothetical protein [unclassified Microcoleus]|nr:MULTISPECIES: hypothetical protein [unclassified Microcoleus]
MNPNTAELRGSIDLLAILFDFSRCGRSRCGRSISSDYFING